MPRAGKNSWVGINNCLPNFCGSAFVRGLLSAASLASQFQVISLGCCGWTLFLIYLFGSALEISFTHHIPYTASRLIIYLGGATSEAQLLFDESSCWKVCLSLYLFSVQGGLARPASYMISQSWKGGTWLNLILNSYLFLNNTLLLKIMYATPYNLAKFLFYMGLGGYSSNFFLLI